MYVNIGLSGKLVRFLGKNVNQMTKKICAVHGDVLTEETVRKWFVQFKIVNLKDQEYLKQLFATNNQIVTTINKNLLCNISEISATTFRTNQYLTVPSLQKEQDFNMPPKRGSKAKIDSTKAKSDKKTETLNEKKSSKQKRANDANDEPAPKRSKIERESKKSKNVNESNPSSTKKGKDEPKQMQNKTDTNLGEIDFGCTKLNEEGEKYNLKICTWNVSGVRAVIKKKGMDYIIEEDADIVALQETKCDKNKLPDDVKLPGYHNYFLDSKKPGYCGLALLCKEKPISIKYGLDNPEFDGEGRIIAAEFSEFFLINVYVPNAGNKLVTLPKRLEWNKVFKKYVQELDEKKPVIICGDMNVAHQEIDLKNPKTNMKNAGFTKEERDDMTDFLAAGFVDTFRSLYPDKEGAYTFWSYFANARSKDIGWRLDYFLVSERIKDKVCDNIIRKQVYGSDHCPVILYINL